MGNVPVIAEIKTSCESLGDVMTGDADAARRRWEDYSEASVIGSGVKAAIAAGRDDMAEAERLGKAMGRATGSAVTGGGFLKDVPLFHEIATAGDSLGDMMAGGDKDAANKRWRDYSENSVVGSGVRSAMAARDGNMEEARRLGINMGKATGSAAVTMAAGVVGGVAGGAVAGAVLGAVGSAAGRAAQGRKVDIGDAVAGGAMGLLGAGKGGMGRK